MKRWTVGKICGFLCTVLTAGALTSCGGEYAGMPGNGPVSGGAVSGTAVTGGAVSQEGIREDRHIYANDTSFYIGAWAEDSEFDLELDSDHHMDYVVGFVGYQKNDLTKREVIKVDGFRGLLCVSEEAVYYCKEDSSGEHAYGVWRMPIQKNEDGTDRLQKEKEEKILVEKDGIITDENRGYTDDRYLVYFTYEGEAVKYNLKTGKQSRHKLEGNIASLEPVNGNNLIIANLYGGLSRWNLDTDEWDLFAKDENAYDEPAATNGETYFYSKSEEDEVRRYDVKSGEEKRFLSEKQLSSACETFVTEQGGTFEWCFLSELFCQGDKLYLELQVDWTKEKAYRMNYVIFSVDLRGETRLRPEKGMMDCIQKNSTWQTLETNKMKGCKKVVWNSGYCLYIIDGKAIFVMDHDKLTGCYDMASGKFEWVSGDDEMYYLPYYDLNASEAYPDWMMEDNSMNFIPEELEEFFDI